MNNVPLIISALSFLLAAAGFILVRADKSKGELVDISGRLSVLEKQVEVFWRGVSFSTAQALHSPHTPDLDRLIERFQQGTITDTELHKFKSMLSEIKESDEDKIRQKFASDVLTLIHIRYEITPEMIAQYG